MKEAEPSKDEKLLQKLTAIVLENFSNEQFGVEVLAKEVGMSRSHLHRKLKLLNGQSISQFIRVIRLEEAMKLLEADAATASEIAYRVGFNSSSYFHKCFLEHYGYQPGEVKKRILESDSDSAEKSATEPEKSETSNRIKGSKILNLAVLVLIGMFVTLLFVYQKPGEIISKSPRSIAVLPLKYVSGDPEQEYLAIGIHDGMIGALGQLSALRVISRTSSLRYRQSQLSLPDIARELGVDAIIEGSVFGAGDSVHLQLQLAGAFPKEQQLWAKDYHHSLGNMLAQHHDMVRNIAKEIQLNLSPEEKSQLAYSPAVDPEAYKAYLKGMYHWDRLTEEDLNEAMKYFERALELDPDYAPAYSGISLVWVGRMQQGLSSYFEGGANMKIEEVKARLLKLNRDVPDVHYIIGLTNCWVDWDYEKSEKELKQVIALNPNHSSARAYLSHVLNILHKPEEATIQIEKALELDPFNPLFQALHGMYLMHTRQYDRAIDLLGNTLKTSPGDPVALATLRTAYHMKEMYPEALEIWETSYAVKEDQEAIETLMRGYRSGGYHHALEQLAETLIDRSDSVYVTPWQIGTLYTRAGKKEAAITWLEKAYEAHDSNMPYIGIDPIFDVLRDDPRFLHLLERMNLPSSQLPLKYHPNR